MASTFCALATTMPTASSTIPVECLPIPAAKHVRKTKFIPAAKQIPIHKTSILESGVAYETADGGETLLGSKDLASMLSTCV